MTRLDALLENVRVTGATLLANTRHARVLRLTVPAFPASARRAEEAKGAILRLVISALPRVRLWLPAQDSDLLTAIGLQPTPQSATAQWIAMERPDLVQLMAVLPRGGWGLFFADSGRLSATPPDQLVFEPGDIGDLVISAGGLAGIVSWFDDNDWLIFVAEGGGGQTPLSGR